jgi:hypothetical protein
MAKQRPYALMRRLWNDGDHSHSDIAEIAGIDVDSVTKWLARQPGYPGLIKARRLTCPTCGKEFDCWSHGAKASRRYCSQWCGHEARRIAWFQQGRRKRGLPPVEPPPRRTRMRFGVLSRSDKRVIDEARREARERGIAYDVVLKEWKFVPQKGSTRT